MYSHHTLFGQTAYVHGNTPNATGDCVQSSLKLTVSIQKTVCGDLEKKVKSLEIQILKDKQYNPHNCVEFSSIPDTINDNNLEDTTIKACKDINIDLSETDITIVVIALNFPASLTL